MRRRVAVSFLPGLSLVMGTALLIEVLSFSLADDTPRRYTRDGTLCAAAAVVIGFVALWIALLRTRIEWEVNGPLMAGGAFLVAFGLAVSAASYAEFTDPQAFAPHTPGTTWDKEVFSGAGIIGSWILIPGGFFFYVLGIRPMKYKAKYEQGEQRPSVFDLMDREREPPRAP